MADEFSLKMPDFHVTFRDLLHAVNPRHGTDGFASLPKEGVLRIFLPRKIRRLLPGLNPRTWVPKASTLLLDHRSRFFSCKQSVFHFHLHKRHENDFYSKPNKSITRKHIPFKVTLILSSIYANICSFCLPLLRL